MIAPAGSVDEEIRAIASMASLALALLVFFTNLRLSVLKEYRKTVEKVTCETVVSALPDLGLALVTGAALLVMAPLCFDSFSFAEVGHRAAAIPSMFALIWLGFVAVFIVQLGMVAIRFCDAHRAGA